MKYLTVFLLGLSIFPTLGRASEYDCNLRLSDHSQVPFKTIDQKDHVMVPIKNYSSDKCGDTRLSAGSKVAGIFVQTKLGYRIQTWQICTHGKSFLNVMLVIAPKNNKDGHAIAGATSIALNVPTSFQAKATGNRAPFEQYHMNALCTLVP